MSWIEVRLEPEAAERTGLVLEHVAHVDDERWLQYGPGAVGLGWDPALMGLALHLESGAPNDPEAAAAWMGSADGVEFVTRSSRGWADASIAAGTGTDAARAAEREVAAFYGAPAG